ncbi:ESPR-type extended signal peptide-containing protein [Megasphaera sp. SW808]|uniref:ESPR-type extended signal peptide-containing protein n=1 Tax=Megasphaera sp. SW808 TaxID=2530045 RepID=UPI001F0E1BA1|nr:ESPR-type extended signal peptide-containing protein [Megasphaera sp. SW808]
MNRIYKVIWSKVKHQYVVVSELAHRDGKRSSAASKSMRSRIAALAVCGAIAVFGVLPIQQVFAAADSTNPSQYIAIKVPSDKKQYDSMVVREKNDKYYYLYGNSGFNAPAYVKQKLTYMENGKEVTAEFFVRDGYTVEAKYGERHDNTSNNLQISAYKNSDAPFNADDGLLTSTQILGTSSEYKTLVGQSLIDTSAGKFGGAVNSPSAGVTSGAEFFTKDKKLSYSQNFKTVEWNDAKNLYQYKGRDVALQNVYVIDGKAGVFVVENDEVYTGTVFGKNNELLTTATDKNGTYYSTWSAEIEDLNTPLTLTKANFDQAMKNVGDSIKLAAGNDIEKVVSTAAQNGNGGSIDLLRQGKYDTESGTYSKDKPKVKGTLSIISTGGTDGEDVAVQFQANGSQPFTVNAGSKVEANKKEVTSPTTSLETLTINGNTYNIPAGKTYSASDGIAISDKNAISVNAGSGLEFAKTADVDGTKKLQVKAGQGIVVDDSGVSVDIVQNGNLYFTDDGKLNSKDYRLIQGTDVIGGTEEQPVYGYKVNEDGTVELAVQDGTDANSKYAVTIADVASKSALDDMGKTLEGAVMYDKDGESYNYGSITLGKKDNKYVYDLETQTASGGVTLTNVAYAVTNRADKEHYIGSAAVNVDLLNDTVSTIKQSVADSDMHLVNGKDVIGGTEEQPELGYKVTDNKVNLKVEGKNESGETVSETVTIANMAEASDLGDVGRFENTDLKNTDGTPTTVVDAVLNMNDKVGDANFEGATHIKDTTTNLTGAVRDLDAAITEATQAATDAGKNHTTVTNGNGIVVTDNGVKDDEGNIAKHEYEVSLADDFKLGGKDGQAGSIEFKGSEGTLSASGNIGAGSFSTTGGITMGKNEAGTNVVSGLGNLTWDATNDYSQSDIAATEAQLQKATEAAVQYDYNEDGTTVNKGSISLGYKDAEGNQQYTQIHNVADGKAPNDAVNVRQLSAVNDLAVNNYQNIQVLNGSINKLDNRIDRVGAGAAALAALHPLDFDPDAKWDFAAGYGNYRGANAVAVGAYYRPNEDVMFSVGGSMGGGENMVNAGVSLKIGAGSSNVTTSRVAMAKEIKSMRDIVAKQDAQIQKLTAMVNALVGVQTETDSSMFPDVPENHWAYEAVEAMAKSGLVKGYPDGEFKGDRTMTRYEFAQIVYNAIQAGAEVDARLVEEFKPELQFFHIATVAKDKDGNPTIERVRAN